MFALSWILALAFACGDDTDEECDAPYDCDIARAASSCPESVPEEGSPCPGEPLHGAGRASRRCVFLTDSCDLLVLCEVQGWRIDGCLGEGGGAGQSGSAGEGGRAGDRGGVGEGGSAAEVGGVQAGNDAGSSDLGSGGGASGAGGAGGAG